MKENQQIQKIINVYVPGNVCNMRCSYCYVTECLKSNHEEHAVFQYSVEHMIEAFRPERIGGIAYILVIGGGETLIPPEVVPFVKGLLRQGHVVEVVTNNTLDHRIDELLEVPVEDRARLIVKCSLHWKELIRMGKVESFFANIRKIVAAGASSYPCLVLGDEYMDCLDEICEACEKEIGALPQCTPCVTVNNREDYLRGGETMTQPPCTEEFVKRIEKKFESRLFSEVVRFLDIDVQNVFCYAGKYAFVVNMDTGIILKCHNVLTDDNFFENIDEPYEGEVIGCECGVASCSCNYNLYAAGMIPEIPNVPTYAELICQREGLFQDEVKRLMDVKVCEGKKILSEEEKIHFLMKQIVEKNILIENLKYAQTAKKIVHDKEGIEKLLGLVDNNKVSYCDLDEVTYGYLVAVYKVCSTMEQGEFIYKGILEKIYKGLLDSHDYEGIDVLYDGNAECNLVNGLKNIPITSMIVCDAYCEAMQVALANKDYREVVGIYFEQLKNW